MKRVLITGIAGFVGSHLAEHLKGGFEVWGTYVEGHDNNLEDVAGIGLVKCDLCEPDEVRMAVKKIRPDGIFHLAGQSAPSLSFKDPIGTFRANVFSTINLLEAATEYAPDAVVVNAGSGEEYGEAGPDGGPVKETAEFKPLNPYAVSKVAQDLLAYQYWRARRLRTIRCRPFNHYGPRQADRFVTAAFARQIAEMEAGIRKERVMHVGSLESFKDFLYVKDVVRAYALLLEKGAYGEAYNICSGRPVQVRAVLDVLLSLTSLKIETRLDPARLRPVDSKVLCGDNAKIEGLGWSPRYGLEQGLGELLEYWRERVRPGAEGAKTAVTPDNEAKAPSPLPTTLK